MSAASASDRPALRRSARSTRAARPIDPPYWEALGYSRETAMDMANFTHFAHTNGEGDHPFPHPGPVFVPFNEQLLPHWRNFIKWVEQDMKDDGEGGTKDNLEICNIEMNKQVFDIVTPAVLRIEGLMRLDLTNNRLGHDGFVAVAEILKCQASLTELHLVNNELVNAESAVVLSEAMQVHPCLKHVRLSENGIGRDVEILLPMLEGIKNMSRVDLRSNQIDAERGGPIIADFVANNHSLLVMDLEGNELNDDNVPLLVDALKKNTTLQIFDVVKNDMTVQGREGMIKAVFDTSSLNAVVSSNHTCQLHVTPESAGPPPLLGFMMMMSSMMMMGGLNNGVEHEETMKSVNDLSLEEGVVRYKVLRALCGRGRRDPVPVQLSYLNDVPVKCMPRVLELIQIKMVLSEPIFGLGHKTLASTRSWSGCLNRVFHVVKGWQMPSLFEYHTSSANPAGRGASARGGRGKRKRSAARN